MQAAQDILKACMMICMVQKTLLGKKSQSVEGLRLQVMIHVIAMFERLRQKVSPCVLTSQEDGWPCSRINDIKRNSTGQFLWTLKLIRILELKAITHIYC